MHWSRLLKEKNVEVAFITNSFFDCSRESSMNAMYLVLMG